MNLFMHYAFERWVQTTQSKGKRGQYLFPLSPESLAATKNGTLLVVEADASRLLEINLVTGTKRTRVDKLPLGSLTVSQSMISVLLT
jgi:hypothetical protein